MLSGYIKLWRKITEWEWYQSSDTKSVFLHLLLNANFKDSKYMGHDILRGDIVIGRDSLSKTLSISPQTIRTCLERLKSTNEITIKSTNKFSIITLCNYENYQGEDLEINQHTNQQINKQSTSNQPTTNQQLTTSEEGKNERREERKKEELHDGVEIPDAEIQTPAPPVQQRIRTDTNKQTLEEYLAEEKAAYEELIKDNVWIETRKKYHPGLNIILSLQKAHVDFWGTESGYENKKSKRRKRFNWKLTFQNALTMKSNQVWIPRLNGGSARETPLFDAARAYGPKTE